MLHRTTRFRRRMSVVFATLLVVAVGCTGQNPSAGSESAGGAPSGTDAATDAGAMDGDAAGASNMDFLLSGSFEGVASVRPEAEESSVEYRTTAILEESRSGIEGVIDVGGGESDAPAFEYVLVGSFDDRRRAAEVELSARRCPFGVESCSNALSPGELPEEPMLTAEVTYQDERLNFGDIAMSPGFEPPSDRNLERILQGLRLAPNFDPGGDRASPGDGVKPAETDAGRPDADAGNADPFPAGETTWTGRIGNGTAVGAPAGSPVSCEWVVFRSAEGLRLRHFDCAGHRLGAEDVADSELPRVVPDSLAGDENWRTIWFLVETSEGFHLFVGERRGDQYTGVVVRDPEVEENGEGQMVPSQPTEYSIPKVESAFHWSRD